MNFLSKTTLGSLMLINGAAFAVEPAMGWYTGLMFGISTTPSRNITLTTPLLSIPARVTYNLFGNLAWQIGYRCNKFRYEGELLYNTNPVSRISSNGFTFTERRRGNTHLIGGLFNVFYEFYDEDWEATRFVPYIGLGLGYANVTDSVNFNVGTVRFRHSHSAAGAIGQAILGFNYFFTDKWSVGTDIRYMSTNTIKQINSRNSSNYSVASWNVLFNYSFDTPY